MSVLFLTGDLMVSSQLSGAAARQQVELQTLSTAAQAIEAVASGTISIVAIDLTLPGLDCQSLVPALREAKQSQGEESLKIVAFGPHVQVPRLEAAREAGCDEVFSRGQFFSQMDEILKQSGQA